MTCVCKLKWKFVRIRIDGMLCLASSFVSVGHIERVLNAAAFVVLVSPDTDSFLDQTR
jgi:hypothetical protein